MIYPQSVVDRCRRLREVHTLRDVATITGIPTTTIQGMKNRGWVAGKPSRQPAPMPWDFPIQANHMTILELCAHYGVGQKSLYKWLRSVPRNYERRPNGRIYSRLVPPPREVIEAAIAQYGIIGAAAHFGIHKNTFMGWRVEVGLPVARRPRRKLAHSQLGWADNYARRAA